MNLKERLGDALKNERYRNINETHYWLHQYKMIAIEAVKELEASPEDNKKEENVNGQDS